MLTVCGFVELDVDGTITISESAEPLANETAFPSTSSFAAFEAIWLKVSIGIQSTPSSASGLRSGLFSLEISTVTTETSVWDIRSPQENVFFVSAPDVDHLSFAPTGLTTLQYDDMAVLISTLFFRRLRIQPPFAAY